MFKGDSDFCLNCGQIMPMATTAPIKLECRNCGVESMVEECDKVINIREFSYEKKIVELDEDTAGGKDHGVQVDHICTKCGHTQATYSTQQTRSADEGQTVFYACVSCGNRDIEYS
ncbi:DNA-directed RNA polymerase subunit [Aphelenchoides bicaudatus]|nr:DNA-directed RNA polymerase subunit [Aphelenchoides bicaudatus]